MYNPYIRDQQGSFTRISEDIPAPPPSTSCGPPPPPPPSSHTSHSTQSPNIDTSFIRRMLGKFGMDNVDTGDLLLLLILFLVFSEGDGRDEELLIAIGLLLIL